MEPDGVKSEVLLRVVGVPVMSPVELIDIPTGSVPDRLQVKGGMPPDAWSWKPLVL